MKIGILSLMKSNKNVYEQKRLLKEIRALGHTAKLFKINEFQAIYAGDYSRLMYGGKPFPKFDIIIVKGSSSADMAIKISVLPELEMMGIPVINKFGPIIKAKDKVKTGQILNYYKIPIPKTVIIRREADLTKSVKILGGFPIIMKTPYGSFGKGVVIVESMRALKSILLWNEPLYILQEYVKYAKGSDIRVIVIDGKVVAAMKRKAKKGEFRSNIHLGGKGVPIKITDEEAQIAIRATQALNLNFSGVDIMRSINGPVVIEVNANPGFKGLEEATGQNIAKEFVLFAERYANGV